MVIAVYYIIIKLETLFSMEDLLDLLNLQFLIWKLIILMGNV
jgi:hypothetical protein